MGFSPNALYQALLIDLQDHLPFEHVKMRVYTEPAIIAQAMKRLMWPSDATLEQVTSLSLLQSLYKRYLPQLETSEDQDNVAISKFVDVNNHAANWEYRPNTSGDEELMGSVREHIDCFWNPEGFPLVFHLHDLFDHGSVGPGSSISARGADYYTKMWSSPLSATSADLAAHYEWWCDADPRYASAESHRRSVFGDLHLTKQNRLSFVPKDSVTSRTIATEPSLNMFAQLGLGEILTDRLRQFFGISLRTQPEWNREAARIGSTDPSNGLVTIDLSSASDSLSLKAAEWLFPRDLMNLLVKLRSPSGVLPDGRSVEYNMVSTMGNGFTFPLQTLVFSSVVVTAIKSLGFKPVRPNRHSPSICEGAWGVFGDDIVCHPTVAPRVLNLLRLFGFTVNSDKTFVEGHFRESCGRDYFKGHDVRGVFVKRPLDSRADLHTTINNFVAWSYRTGINLPSAGRYLSLLLASKGQILFAPLDESLVSGVRVPKSLLGFKDPMRTNENGSFLYKRLLPAAKQLRIGDGFVSVPKGEKWRIFNPEGLLLAFLHGSVRTGRISIRQNDTRYRVKGCVVPNWDYITPVSDLLRHVGDRLNLKRLETASRVFLSEVLYF